MFAKSFFAGFLVVLAAASASAGVVTDVLVSPGTELAVPFVNKFSVANFDMNGMKVTAYFNNIPTESGTWSGNQASNTNFKLSETGDTFDKPWTLENLNSTALLTKLVIEGKPGFTLFDLEAQPQPPPLLPTFRTTAGSVLPPAAPNVTEGTADSELGYTFFWANATNIANLNVTATYSDIVRLNAAASPIGDIWSTLTIDFGGSAGGLAGPNSFFPEQTNPFVFFADTDTWGNRTTTPNDPVPEPSSICLLAGLGLIATCRGLRRNSRLSLRKRALLSRSESRQTSNPSHKPQPS